MYSSTLMTCGLSSPLLVFAGLEQHLADDFCSGIHWIEAGFQLLQWTALWRLDTFRCAIPRWGNALVCFWNSFKRRGTPAAYSTECSGHRLRTLQKRFQCCIISCKTRFQGTRNTFWKDLRSLEPNFSCCGRKIDKASWDRGNERYMSTKKVLFDYRKDDGGRVWAGRRIAALDV